MPGPDSFAVKSSAQSHIAGSTLRFNSWIPRRGPLGGRVVIDGFELIADFTDINITTTAVQGADLWRAFKRIQIEQAGGALRWNLRGDESRAMCYLLEGPQRVREVADSATTADQAIRVAVYIPMERRFAVEPRDFSMPVDLFQELRLECADVTELDDDGGTVTIDACNYSVIAWCHEEFNVKVGPFDMVMATSLPSTAGLTIPIAGRLHDLAFYARGTSGGASVANFTDVRIDNVLPVAISRLDLLGAYQRDRRNATNLASADGSQVRMDPYLNGKGVPVLWTTERSSVFDGALLDQAVIYTTNSVASLLALYRVVKPRDPQVVAAIQSRYGLSADSWRVKTKSKSKRARDRWSPEQEAFLPLVAPLYR
jgi:hypothetical protein